MPSSTDRYPGYRFPRDVIAYAVWLYHRFTLSLRNVQEILFERGVVVSHESLRQWGVKFGPEYVEKLRRREPKRGDAWHMDEVAVKLGKKQHWLWRAVDGDGYVLDVLLQERRDKGAAKRFFERLLSGLRYVPKKIVTDKLRSYAAALRELPELAAVEHEEVRAAARQNNLIEQSHRPTREQERQRRCFRSPPGTQQFLSVHARIANLFRLPRHRLPSHEYRHQLCDAFQTWADVTGVRAPELSPTA